MNQRKLIKNNLILLLSFVLSVVVVMQSKIMQDRYIYTGVESVKEMEESLRFEKIELENLYEFKLSRQKELESDKKEYEEGRVTETLEKNLVSKKMQAGYTQLKGQGVQIELRDSTKELAVGEDPNDLLIHDQDILMLINDLKVAGAEAISVNGERVLSTTEIKCTGATIMINNITFGQPFIIKAIGEPAELEAAVLAPSTYGSILKELYHLQIDVEQKEVLINAAKRQ
ncbi:DUF881 domain-containing protein [Filifactor villosus]|uniref:DUF881 domain-containing protein n=1 Tax=Filifactor villosus TaxID=29374 RepID=A0ABV9QPG3_9FIRM